MSIYEYQTGQWMICNNNNKKFINFNHILWDLYIVEMNELVDLSTTANFKTFRHLSQFY